MKSVKPGRGPSFMGGLASIAVAAVGVIWTVFAAEMGAPGFFVAFGVIFILMAAGGAIYNFYSASARNRFSAFDITEEGEEPDPLNVRFSGAETNAPPPGGQAGFCPYCGAEAQKDYRYCKKCGKAL